MKHCREIHFFFSGMHCCNSGIQNNRNCQKNNKQGFTLIELIISIAILSIALSIAVPSFTQLINQNKVASQADELLSSFAVARAEAIKENQVVTICKSSNQTSCTSSDDWIDGWIVFFDSVTANGQVDVGESIIHKFYGAPSNFVINTSSLVTNSISFRPTGEITNAGGDFVICGAEKNIEYGQKILIGAMGRPRREKGVSSCS